jgi:hypothetical protein
VTFLDALLTLGLTLTAGVIGFFGKRWWDRWEERRIDSTLRKGSSRLGGRLFRTLAEISDQARRELGKVRFIGLHGTGDALMNLAERARKTDTIVALCGKKGDYSRAYYELNFRNAGAVLRVFSYEALEAEIQGGADFGLEGLRVHLDRRHQDSCRVDVRLVPKKVTVASLLEPFTPPIGFGFAILVGPDGRPRQGVVHWESSANVFADLVEIEGVAIPRQCLTLLRDFVSVHRRIARSTQVLDPARDSKEVQRAIERLEALAGEKVERDR